jgi:hypothetical protein
MFMLFIICFFFFVIFFLPWFLFYFIFIFYILWVIVSLYLYDLILIRRLLQPEFVPLHQRLLIKNQPCLSFNNFLSAIVAIFKPSNFQLIVLDQDIYRGPNHFLANFQFIVRIFYIVFSLEFVVDELSSS